MRPSYTFLQKFLTHYNWSVILSHLRWLLVSMVSLDINRKWDFLCLWNNILERKAMLMKILARMFFKFKYILRNKHHWIRQNQLAFWNLLKCYYNIFRNGNFLTFKYSADKEHSRISYFKILNTSSRKLQLLGLCPINQGAHRTHGFPLDWEHLHWLSNDLLTFFPILQNAIFPNFLVTPCHVDVLHGLYVLNFISVETY